MITLRCIHRLTDLILVLATWGVVLSVRARETPAPPAEAAPREPGDQYTIVPADAPEAERKPGDPADTDVIVDETGHRAPLATRRGNGNGEYDFSPDEHWLYGNYHVGSGMAAGELFAHGAGPRFTPVGKKEFSDAAWDFCVRQGGISASDLPPEGSDARIIDFGAWSPDSARLLVSLRGGERHGKTGTYAWHLYWNTHTGAFELTDYLRGLNKEAARRWSDDNLRFAFPPAVCAEPLPGGWPAAAEFEKQYKSADGALNSCYARYIAKLPPAKQKDQRNAQRAWIKHRDEGAITYAKLGDDTGNKEARHWQYLAAATQKRTKELELETSSDAASSDSGAAAPAADDSPSPTPAPAVTAESLNDDNTLFSPSPDGRFAFRKFNLPNDADSSQSGESWLDLVASKTGKTFQPRVAVKDADDTRFLLDVVWSPDSRRFALGICPTRLTAYLKVFILKGDTFHEVTLPEFPPVEVPEKYHKKDHYWHMTENDYSRPVRWQKDGSLVAEISTGIDGNGMVTATRTFVLAVDDHSDKARIAQSKFSVKVERE